jgi:histone H3/H4
LEEVINMISQKMFKDACYAAGAKQVSDAAAIKFDAWMTRFMKDVAAKAVKNAHNDRRVRIEPQDIGE